MCYQAAGRNAPPEISHLFRYSANQDVRSRSMWHVLFFLLAIGVTALALVDSAARPI
jgi:hypothetical protein